MRTKCGCGTYNGLNDSIRTGGAVVCVHCGETRTTLPPKRKPVKRDRN